MNVVQINTIEFEDLLDGVYKIEKRLDKIDEKLSGHSVKCATESSSEDIRNQ